MGAPRRGSDHSHGFGWPAGKGTSQRNRQMKTGAVLMSLAAATLLACTPAKPASDSTATLPAPDTLKAGPASLSETDSTRRADSVAAARPAAPSPGTKAKAPSTKAASPVTKAP